MDHPQDKDLKINLIGKNKQLDLDGNATAKQYLGNLDERPLQSCMGIFCSPGQCHQLWRDAQRALLFKRKDKKKEEKKDLILP